MASSVVFKVKYEDTLRRFNVLVNEDQRFDLNMEGLKLKICSLFNLASSANFSLVYTDEDDDVVTLGNDEDLHDILKQGLNPVRITVCLKTEKTSTIGASSIGNSTPGGSSVPNLEHKVNPNVAEVLKSVPEPLIHAISKISTELTSKAASASPVLGDLLDGLSKMGQSYLIPHPACGTTNISGPAEGHDDPKQKAPMEQKVDAPTDNKGVKHNDISTSSPVQQSSNSTQATRESDFIQPSLFPFLQFHGKNATTEQIKNNKEDYEKLPGKYRGCRMLNSSKGGVKKRVSSEKDAGKSAAAGNSRGFLFGRNPSRPYYSFEDECPFSGITPSLGRSITGDQEKCVYDNAPPVQAHHDTIFHKGVRCDGCGVLPITGPRFKSKVKHNYDLCSICFGRLGNDLDYTRINFPLPYRHTWALGSYDPTLHIPPMLPLWTTRRHAGKQSRSRLDSRFIMDVNVMDGTMMAPSTPFTKIWRMRNNGTVPWQRGLQLLWIGGDRFSPSDAVEIQVPADGVSVGKEVDIAVDFVAPELPGRYISYWRMADPSGQKFGQRVWVLVQVDATADLTLESSPGLNLNIPPESTVGACGPQWLDGNGPELNAEAPLRSPSMVERTPKVEMDDLNFPINDDLLVTSDVIGLSLGGASSSAVPDNGVDVFCEASSSVSNPDVAGNGSHDSPVSPPSAPPKPLYPIIDMHDGSSASSSDSKNDKSTLEQDHGKNPVEETLLKELEEMGFKQIDLNKEVLRENEYDLELSVDELCGVSEWDPILEELKEMGFEDKETNKRLLEKNNGSITRVVMDLIAGEKP